MFIIGLLRVWCDQWPDCLTVCLSAPSAAAVAAVPTVAAAAAPWTISTNHTHTHTQTEREQAEKKKQANRKLLIIVTKGNKDFISTECKGPHTPNYNYNINNNSNNDWWSTAAFLTVQATAAAGPKRIIKKLSKQAIGKQKTTTQHY